MAKGATVVTDGWAGYEALMRLGRGQERAQVLADFCKVHPTPEMLFYLAHAWFQLRRFDECERALLEAERLDPMFGAAFALHGDVYFAQERYAEAVRKYEAALAVDAVRLGESITLRIAAAKNRTESTSP